MPPVSASGLLDVKHLDIELLHLKYLDIKGVIGYDSARAMELRKGRS
jgi:hypothetical protein